MGRVIVRPQAEADILDYWLFIAGDSPAAANRWAEALDDKMQLWSTQPMMGRSRPELADDIRSIAYGNYVVFFLPLSDGIDVVRVLHGRQDIEGTFTF